MLKCAHSSRRIGDLCSIASLGTSVLTVEWNAERVISVGIENKADKSCAS